MIKLITLVTSLCAMFLVGAQTPPNCLDLNPAINAANASGGVVYLTGTCTLDVTGLSGNLLNTLSDKVTIEGESPDSTIIQLTGTVGANLVVFQAAAGANVAFHNITTIGTSSSIGSYTVNAISHLGTGGSVTLDNVVIKGSGGQKTLSGALKTEPGALTVGLLNSTFQDLSNVGFLAVPNTASANSHYIIDKCLFKNIGTTTLHHGLYIEVPYAELKVTDNTFDSITGGGIHQNGGVSGQASGETIITGNNFRSNGAGGAIILTPEGNTFTSTLITGNGFNTSLPMNIQRAATITGNSIYGTNGGITVQGAAVGGVISGNTFIGPDSKVFLTDAGVKNWGVTGNAFTKSSANANPFIILSGVSNISIADNMFVCNGNAPIDIKNAANNVSVTDNMITGSSNYLGIYVRSTAADPISLWMDGNKLLQSDRAWTVEVSGIVGEGNYQATSGSLASGKYINLQP